MNATLARDTRHDSAQQSHSVRHEQHTPVRRVGLADSAALHLGVALITWSRRPAAAPQHERRANRLERALAERKSRAHAMAALDSRRLDYALMARMR